MTALGIVILCAILLLLVGLIGGAALCGWAMSRYEEVGGEE